MPPRIGVERIPVGFTERSEGPARLCGTVTPGREDETPMSGLEPGPPGGRHEGGDANADR